MKSILTDKKEITHAVELLRRKIRTAFPNAMQDKIGFPGGGTASGVRYSATTSLGTLTVMIPNKHFWNRRIPHLINLNPSQGIHAPDVELNIPLSLNRTVSACCVRDGKDILICSRGKFTVFKAAVPKDQSMRFFREWLISVVDGDRQAEVIPVAALSSPALADQIAAFVSQVKMLKEKYKDGLLHKELSRKKGWRETSEFQGKVKKSSPSRKTEYEYLHGPICNSLKLYLEHINNGSNIAILSNENVDVAVVQDNKAQAIFEVKTSLNFSEQIYKGIGQLLCYKAQYGADRCKLFLVVPRSNVDKSSLQLLQKVLPKVGITLVFWKTGRFIGADNQDLRTLLS